VPTEYDDLTAFEQAVYGLVRQLGEGHSLFNNLHYDLQQRRWAMEGTRQEDTDRARYAAIGDDPGGYRAEFLDLVRRAKQLVH
jgi:hypothetical protein